MDVFGYKKLDRERADWLEKEVSMEKLKNAV